MRSEKYVGSCSNVVIKTDCWSPIPMQQCEIWKLQQWKVRTEVLCLKLYWSFFIHSLLALHTPILWQQLPTNNNPGVFLDCTCSLHPVPLSHPKWWIASRLLFGLGAPCLHWDSRTMETRVPQFSLWALQFARLQEQFCTSITKEWEFVLDLLQQVKQGRGSIYREFVSAEFAVMLTWAIVPTFARSSCLGRKDLTLDLFAIMIVNMRAYQKKDSLEEEKENNWRRGKTRKQ